MHIRIFFMAGEGLDKELKQAINLAAVYGFRVAEDVDAAEIVVIIGNDRDLLYIVQSLEDIAKPILGVSPGDSESILTSISLEELGFGFKALKREQY